MAKKKRYSYIKNPYSVNGWYSLAAGALSFAVTAVLLVCSIRNRGSISMRDASAGACAIVLGFAGILFLLAALGEKKRNRFFAFTGGGLSAISIAVWCIVLTAAWGQG